MTGSRLPTRPDGPVGGSGIGTRRQLSLYLTGESAGPVEAVRGVVDPVQARLIPAHVTLCRDDELFDVTSVLARLTGSGRPPLALRFGRAEAFGTHGLLLPCIRGEDEFRELRWRLLGSAFAKEQRPHITLAHPRNPRAAGNSLEATRLLPPEFEVSLPRVHLIEQIAGQPWRVLETFELDGVGREGE